MVLPARTDLVWVPFRQTHALPAGMAAMTRGSIHRPGKKGLAEGQPRVKRKPGRQIKDQERFRARCMSMASTRAMRARGAETSAMAPEPRARPEWVGAERMRVHADQAMGSATYMTNVRKESTAAKTK